MPIHPNVRRCIYSCLNGQRCGSPAVTGRARCWHHEQIIERRSRIKVPFLKNPADLQQAVMDVIQGLLTRRLGALVLARSILGRAERAHVQELLYARGAARLGHLPRQLHVATLEGDFGVKMPLAGVRGLRLEALTWPTLPRTCAASTPCG